MQDNAPLNSTMLKIAHLAKKGLKDIKLMVKLSTYPNKTPVETSSLPLK